jgi:hypothetical protein
MALNRRIERLTTTNRHQIVSWVRPAISFSHEVRIQLANEINIPIADRFFNGHHSMAVPDPQWSFRDPDDPLVPPVRTEPAEEDPLLTAIGQMATAILLRTHEPPQSPTDEPPARDEPPHKPTGKVAIPEPAVSGAPLTRLPLTWRISRIVPALLMVFVTAALLWFGFSALGEPEF